MQNDEIRFLVRLYEESRCLWDPKEDGFFDKRFREGAWNHIGKQMNMSVKALKDKMTSLMGSYRREKSREKRSDSCYKSKWFAYDWFHFLINRDNPRTFVDMSSIPGEQANTPAAQKTDADEHQREENRRKNIKSKISAPKRRLTSTPELQEVREDLTNTLNRIDRLIKDQQRNNDQEEDEFELYGRLLAKRLRQFSQRESLEVMYEIDGLVLNRIHNQSEPVANNGDSASTPPSPLTVIIAKRSVSPASPYTTPVPSP